MTYPIMDLSDNQILGIITTETTNQQQLEQVIWDVKARYPEDYCYDDLAQSLPADCGITWFDKDDAVWW